MHCTRIYCVEFFTACTQHALPKRFLEKIVQSPKFNQAEYLTVITLLLNRQILPPKYVNHELKGSYSGFWDCHITNDCVLIYKVIEGELRLARIGTHSEVFNK